MTDNSCIVCEYYQHDFKALKLSSTSIYLKPRSLNRAELNERAAQVLFT